MVIGLVRAHSSFPSKIKTTSRHSRLLCIDTVIVLYSQAIVMDPPLEAVMISTSKVMLTRQQIRTQILAIRTALHLATVTVNTKRGLY